MVEVLRRAAETGRGGAVFLRGEPGIGKSRLMCEMEDDARAAGFAWMWIDSAPHRMDSPYRTVRNMVDWLADEQGLKAGVVARQLLFGEDVAPTLDPETSRLMLGAIAVLARDSEMLLLPEEGWESGPLDLVDPAEFQAGLRLATHLWVNRMVAGMPRCVVFDDFQWIDPSSRVLLDIMVRMAADLPLVLLIGVPTPGGARLGRPPARRCRGPARPGPVRDRGVGDCRCRSRAGGRIRPAGSSENRRQRPLRRRDHAYSP